MREQAPPPVQVELGCGRTGQALVTALVALAASAFAAWTEWPWAWGGVPLAAGLGAWLAQPQRGTLTWDGRTWSWCGTTAVRPGLARIMLDLGDALVLRFQPASGAPVVWWWLGRREAGGAWHGLRVALVQQPAASRSPA